MQPTDIAAILTRAADQWDKTEKLLKTVEMIEGELSAPSINELRYAGRRLVDAVRELTNPTPDSLKVQAYLLEVEQFCYRAQHDAVDTVIHYLKKVLTHMEETFGPDLLYTHFGNYTVLSTVLNDVAKTVVNSRAHRGKRAELYDEIQQIKLPKIVGHMEELKAAEQALLIIAEKEQKREAARQEELRQLEIARAEQARLAQSAVDELVIAKKWTRISVGIAIFFGMVTCVLAYPAWRDVEFPPKAQNSAEQALPPASTPAPPDKGQAPKP